jgi:hypothetical protein
MKLSTMIDIECVIVLTCVLNQVKIIHLIIERFDIRLVVSY